jgi:hypothetical protein
MFLWSRFNAPPRNAYRGDDARRFHEKRRNPNCCGSSSANPGLVKLALNLRQKWSGVTTFAMEEIDRRRGILI